MTRDLADLARSASAAAAGLPDAQRRGVTAAAKHTTTIIRAEIRRASGGDSRLSGVGKRGAKVGARYRAATAGPRPTAYIKAIGPLQLIERDTDPHRIPRIRGKRARKRWAVIDGNVRASAQHPGTRGKKPFLRGWRRARPGNPAVMRREVGRSLARDWQAAA